MFRPYDRLGSRTFIGLLIAEFLAAFNDQCLQVAAMFFAIHQGVLREESAIALVPLLFYTPWALFCTLAGYCSDRFSKRWALVIWKVAEVGITGLALAGFWLGSSDGPWAGLGPWLVLAGVFLMGTHSSFYAPAKYGVLPEIFTPRLLSRANGLIESTTFLAVILGLMAGGMLSYVFQGREVAIGLFLCSSALIGTVTSFLIVTMPPADPERPFPGWLPWRLYRPVVEHARGILASRHCTAAVLGLTSFTFVVAFMRQSIYLFGQAQVSVPAPLDIVPAPRWTEFHTSLMVAVVALGVGISSPLAGWLSGGRVERGLTPLGGLGISIALIAVGLSIGCMPALLAALGLVGLAGGFYLVPLYTLLQHSAPKESKGSTIAVNNLLGVIGALSASLVFFLVVRGWHALGLGDGLLRILPVTGGLIAIGCLFLLRRPMPDLFVRGWFWLRRRIWGGKSKRPLQPSPSVRGVAVREMK